MNYNKHLELNGGHAVFSASQSSWLRYDDEKILERVDTLMAKNLGTEIHEFAKSQIDMRLRSRSNKGLQDSLMTYIYRKYYDDENDCISAYGDKLLHTISRLPKDTLTTVQMYINDGVGFCMKTEVKLVYDPTYFYGTADAICYRDNTLIIHDLKTGMSPVKMDQLLLYAAYFCLEYKIKPNALDRIELRIYQNAEAICHVPDPEEVEEYMNKIIYNRKLIYNAFEGGIR